MNADIEVIFHFNDNRTLYEGFRPSHLIDGVNLTTGVHHYYDTSNTEVKGTIESIHRKGIDTWRLSVVVL